MDRQRRKVTNQRRHLRATSTTEKKTLLKKANKISSAATFDKWKKVGFARGQTRFAD